MAEEVCKDTMQNLYDLFDRLIPTPETSTPERLLANIDASRHEELEAVKRAARRFLRNILVKHSTQAYFCAKEGDSYEYIAEERLTSIDRSLGSCRTALQVMRVVYERGVLWQVPPKTNRNLIRRIY